LQSTIRSKRIAAPVWYANGSSRSNAMLSTRKSKCCYLLLVGKVNYTNIEITRNPPFHASSHYTCSGTDGLEADAVLFLLDKPNLIFFQDRFSSNLVIVVVVLSPIDDGNASSQDQSNYTTATTTTLAPDSETALAISNQWFDWRIPNPPPSCFPPVAPDCPTRT